MIHLLAVSLRQHTVDGQNPAQVDGLSHYVQGFIHPDWCRNCCSSTVGLDPSELVQGVVFINSGDWTSLCVPRVTCTTARLHVTA